MPRADRRWIGGIGFGLLICTQLLAAQDPRMDQLVQSYVDAQKFMGSVLVARGDTVLLSKGYGMANLEWQIANTPRTKFRLASITKQFTAAGILLLEEAGELQLDDHIGKYLSVPASWQGITIHHLLTHTSGIPNITAMPDFDKLQRLPTTPDASIAMLKDKPLDFAPGEKMRYSNSGYIVLGALIEKLSGMSYDNFIASKVFSPLEMKDSGYAADAPIISRRAAGYSRTPQGEKINARYIDMTVPFSAGGLYSTTEDLLKWENGLFGGKILSPASLEKMTTPFKDEYAYGVSVPTIQGHRAITHSGDINGFDTELIYFPDARVTVVVLANLNGKVPHEIAPKLGLLAVDAGTRD